MIWKCYEKNKLWKINNPEFQINNLKNEEMKNQNKYGLENYFWFLTFFNAKELWLLWTLNDLILLNMLFNAKMWLN